jgi:hypothetical protein
MDRLYTISNALNADLVGFSENEILSMQRGIIRELSAISSIHEISKLG